MASNLPPGVTNKMIEEAMGDGPDVTFYEAFFETADDWARKLKVKPVDEELLNALAEFAWKKMGEAYGNGYKECQADQVMAKNLEEGDE